MSLIVRPLTDKDYEEILLGWWKEWDWQAPPKDFLPNNGMNGLMVLDGDIPVCAGFIYMTNSAVSWVDWIISSKTYRKKPTRKEAIRLLIGSLSDVCEQSGSRYIYALIKNTPLIEVYKEFGYIKGDTYNSEMIKVI